MLIRFLNDESGVIISAEMVLVMSVAILALIVGLAEVAIAVNTELNDLSNSVGSFNQSYGVTGFHNRSYSWKFINLFNGSAFFDGHDDGDNNTTCDLVCGPPAPTCG
jgi:hypothetical protein